ncbi:hypothetical protein [Idiomarina sp.]|uniref:hypothetical protein n=1 Tax=Idiomarina sp. TaxID=1874361 RepID=UPI00258F8E15|nr:hypothetical protein [Idiomarina sp.]
MNNIVQKYSYISVRYVVLVLSLFHIEVALAQQDFGNTEKLDSSQKFGQEVLEWRREFGSGEGLRTFSATAIDKNDQSIILAGISQMPEITQLFTQGGNPIEQIIVQKIDFYGNTLWIKPFSLSVTEPNRARSVAIMDDGSYLLSGYHGGITAMTNYAVKIDPEGNEVWKRRIGGVGDFVYSIEETPDGGFMTTGRKSHKGKKVAWLAKFNEDMRIIGEAIFEDISVANLNFVNDGSFHSIAINRSPKTDEKALSLTKFSVTGEMQWSKYSMPSIELGRRTLGLSSVEYDEEYIWVAGTAVDYNRGEKHDASMWLVKLNYQGEIIWTHEFKHDGEMASIAYLTVGPDGLAGSMRLQDAFGAEVDTTLVFFNFDGTIREQFETGSDTISDLSYFNDSSLLIIGEKELSVKKYRSGRSYASSLSYVERRKP